MKRYQVVLVAFLGLLCSCSNIQRRGRSGRQVEMEDFLNRYRDHYSGDLVLRCNGARIFVWTPDGLPESDPDQTISEQIAVVCDKVPPDKRKTAKIMLFSEGWLTFVIDDSLAPDMSKWAATQGFTNAVYSTNSSSIFTKEFDALLASHNFQGVLSGFEVAVEIEKALQAEGFDDIRWLSTKGAYYTWTNGIPKNLYSDYELRKRVEQKMLTEEKKIAH